MQRIHKSYNLFFVLALSSWINIWLYASNTNFLVRFWAYLIYFYIFWYISITENRYSDLYHHSDKVWAQYGPFLIISQPFSSFDNRSKPPMWWSKLPNLQQTFCSPRVARAMPRAPQGAPKRPRATQDAPERPRAPQSVPSTPKSTPRTSQHCPRAPQER